MWLVYDFVLNYLRERGGVSGVRPVSGGWEGGSSDLCLYSVGVEFDAHPPTQIFVAHPLKYFLSCTRCVVVRSGKVSTGVCTIASWHEPRGVLLECVYWSTAWYSGTHGCTLLYRVSLCPKWGLCALPCVACLPYYVMSFKSVLL